MWKDVSDEAYPNSDFLYYVEEGQPRSGNVGKTSRAGSDWYATAEGVDLGLFPSKIAAQDAVEDFINKIKE